MTTGGNVSENQGPGSMDYTSSTTIRHGTSGGNLLLVANKLNNDDDPEPNKFSVNHVGEKEVEEEEAPVQSESAVQIATSNVTVMPVNLDKEVMQITANELDDIMMSHSSYLKTAQSPENQFSTFEQWVFLDQEPKTREEKKEGSVVNETNHEAD